MSSLFGLQESSRGNPFASSDETWMSKDECQRQATTTLDNWRTCLKLMQQSSHDETIKTAKQFTHVDAHAKHTIQALEKTSKIVDSLLDKRMAMNATVSTLTEIQSNLGLEQLAKAHWL
ncbi:hypothetical protein DM01DRAFT_1403994 [Hesseltinella vesiculosa]|uniref:BLOC-1-related complex subunit 7 n=1 Tax=Hesseltinella vesiculosa TaxID=101127 RepID=A0A1X2GWA4_9FUNG|nr:hypothetical protein DM01DRAFT_1403994 [Hesseltinella vesiculosa]